MSLGAQTVVVDGQRFAVPTGAAYNPYGFGQLVQPQPIQNVNFPPMVQSGGGGGGLWGEQVGGYGTAGANVQATQVANRMPFGLRESPVWWAILALVISIAGLTIIHWRKTIIGGTESVEAGPAHESAEAGVA
jgi:hypothetical protein